MFLGEADIGPDLRVYAIGDVHGRVDCLTQLLELIEADKAANPASAVKIVMLGDYTDRGPDSRAVVELLAGRANGEDFICLRGNHDQWFLSFLTDPDEGDGFLSWGGIQTLESYGVDLTGSIRSNAELARELSRLVPAEHRRFLSHLPLFHEEGDYFFCHAGVRPGVALQFQDPHDLMWIRGEFHAHKGDFGKVVVHGHTPQAQVEFHKNRINIDTRAFDTGILTALVLEGTSQRLLQTGAG
jgi:diadenosine tetraphosphatase ApaH/serine/threonine PP2A family protein phosphatase